MTPKSVMSTTLEWLIAEADCAVRLDGVLALAAPHPVLVHNMGSGFTVDISRVAHAKSEVKNRARFEKKPLAEAELVREAMA
jgi:hypothetical protein